MGRGGIGGDWGNCPMGSLYVYGWEHTWYVNGTKTKKIISFIIVRHIGMIVEVAFTPPKSHADSWLFVRILASSSNACPVVWCSFR